MTSLKINKPGRGRRTEPEIIAEALRRYSADLVGAVARVDPASKAEKLEGPVASFNDSREAYYIHQRGGDFLRWETEEIPAGTGAEHVIFVFSIGTGFGSALPQPSGSFELSLNAKKLLSFRVTKESMRWDGGTARLYYDVKQLHYAPPGSSLCLDPHIREDHTASFGVAFLLVPKSLVGEGRSATLEVKALNRQPSERWFKLDVGPWGRPLAKAYLDSGMQAVTAPDWLRKSADFHLLFGDIHAHSGHGTAEIRGCGTGSIDENYLYARDVSSLDIFALADHDWQMQSETDWRLRLDKAEQYNRSGSFIALPCFEWTSPNYGHRNVYYKTPDGPFYHSSRAINVIEPDNQNPQQLWNELRKLKMQAITIPHHPNVAVFPVDWSYRDPQFDRLVEVYSSWGNSEHLGAPYMGSVCDREPGIGALDALLAGHRLGLVASSDGHDANPGNAQWCDRQRHLKHHLGSGLVAVLAEEFTRDAVFDALYARRCYATTGTRIILDFSANGRPMGSELTAKAGKQLRFHCSVRGTTDLDHVELVRNGEVIWRMMELRCLELDAEIQEAAAPSAFYYLRVSQTDGEMAWSSPIWID